MGLRVGNFLGVVFNLSLLLIFLQCRFHGGESTAELQESIGLGRFTDAYNSRSLVNIVSIGYRLEFSWVLEIRYY